MITTTLYIWSKILATLGCWSGRKRKFFGIGMRRGCWSLLFCLVGLLCFVGGKEVEENGGEFHSRTHCLDVEDLTLCPAGPCECLKGGQEDWPRRCHSSGIIDYLQLYYCTLSPLGVPSLWQVLYVFWCFLLFGLLFQVTRGYFIPSLSRLSEKLKVSNSVAGVTFLSFGNGATDVFASSTAIAHGSPELAGGMLIGSGVMAITIIIACVVFGSSEIKVQRRPFLRDSIFFLISCTLIFCMLLFRCVSPVFPLSLLLLYGLYVGVVVVGRMLGERGGRERRGALGIVEDVEELREVAELLDGEEREGGVMLDELLFVSKMQDDDPFSEEDDYSPSSASTSVSDSASPSFSSSSSPSRPFSFGEPLSDDSYSFFEDVERYLGWREKSFIKKLLFISFSPLLLVQSATMPLLREQYWSITRFFICICPFSINLLVILYLVGVGVEVGVATGVVVVVVGGLVGGGLVWLTRGGGEEVGERRGVHTFVLVSVVVGLFWIYCLTTEILNILRTLARIWATSEVILGLTLFAWGNSLVDLVSNITVAKQGFKNMAISACLGASSFSILVGLGAPIAVSTLFHLSHYQHEIIPSPFAFSFICVAFTVLCMVIVVPLQGFWITYRFCFLLMGIYVIYGLILLFSEFKVIPFTLTLPETTLTC